MPHKTDKGCFGGTWRVVLAENEDAVAKIGWQPTSVDQGFKAGDNLVTVSWCTERLQALEVGAPTAEKILDDIAPRIVDAQLPFIGGRPRIIMSPCVAEGIAKGGYSKDKVRQYFYEHAKSTAKRAEQWALGGQSLSLCERVELGSLPKQYCESTDPDRLVPIVLSPGDFMITVSGDPGRDHCLICAQMGNHLVSKKIELPANWKELLRKC